MSALTGLRFFLALWVVAYHVARHWLTSTDGPARNVLAGAPVAVTTFFVLSGFVLTWVYAGKSVNDGLDKRAFFAARFARLAPVYVLAVLLAIPIGMFLRAKGFVDDGYLSLLFVATATQAWVPSAALQWNAPLWSLSVELFFYAMFPLLLPALLRMSRGTLVVITVTSWCASVALGLAYDALDPDGLGVVGVESTGTWLHVLRFNPLVRLPDFIVGIVAARLFVDGARIPRHLTLVAALAAIAFIIGVLALGPPVPLLHGALFAPAAALLIFALASGDATSSLSGATSSPLHRALSTSFLLLLGEASYALYVLHIPVILWIAAFTRTKLTAPEGISVAFGVGVSIASVLAAIAVFVVVERPLRERLRRALTR